MRLRRYWHPERLLETGTFLGGRAAGPVQCAHGPGRDALSDRARRRVAERGIDSPAIAAFAAPRHLERSGTPLHAISVVYPRYPSVDESRYVALLADAFGMPLDTYEQSVNALPTGVLDALADTPFPGAALAQYAEDYRARGRSASDRSSAVSTPSSSSRSNGTGWTTI